MSTLPAMWGTELLVAGMLIMAGGYDGKPLGYAEGVRSRQGER
jgi:hypothetical protein